MIDDALLRSAVAQLAKAGISNAGDDVRRIDRFVQETCDTDNHEITFLQAIKARAQRQPVAQITGRRAFWKFDFHVTSDTLDPRPESELLVELATPHNPARVLELGTGTGAVLLSILSEVTSATGVGSDISPAALGVAKINATEIAVLDRLSLVQSDWFDSVSGEFDVIVCNPPYIPAAQIAGLEPEVKDWEPILALSPGPSGLESYIQLSANLERHLTADGRAYFEFGEGQRDRVSDVFASAGLKVCAIHKDLSGKDRVVEVAKD